MLHTASILKSNNNNPLSAGSLTQIKDVHDEEITTATSTTTTTIISQIEAESIIDTLKAFEIKDIGTSEFMQMYGYHVERLTLQAHASAQCQQYGREDEYVIDALLTYDKVSILVKTLIAIESWRIFVLRSNENQNQNDDNNNNHNNNNNNNNSNDTSSSSKSETQTTNMMEYMAKHGNSLRCAFILHAETSLVSLLNLIMYRKEHCEELDSEIIVAMVDYCARQMSSLAASLPDNEMLHRQREPGTIQEIAKHIQTRSTIEAMVENKLETEFQTAVVATSLASHLCEHIDSLPLAAQTRILDTHDYLMMMIPLIDEPPWTRRRIKSSTSTKDCSNTAFIWEKLMDDQEWKEVESSELLHMTKNEAQCWFAVFHLTCSNVCRERYALNVFRKEQLLRLRKFLNDIVIDQIPVLADVMRYMDELSLMYVPESSTGQGSALLMQQVDTVRESILYKCVWKDVINSQIEHIYSKMNDSNDMDLRLIAQIYNEETFGDFRGSTAMNDDSTMIFHVELVTISLCKDIDFYEIFYLTPDGRDEGTTTQTPNGVFRRTKMKVVPVDHENNDLQTIPSSGAKLQANVSFKDVAGVKQFSIDLMLPKMNESCENHVVDSQMKWIQLGRLEDQLVLQLGFKPCLGGGLGSYNLEQAYLSQPEHE